MVVHPGEYRWSSYASNGQGLPNLMISPHSEYLSLDSTDDSRRQAYRGLFRSHMDAELIDEIRHATNGNFALGNEQFKQDIARMLQRRVTHSRRGALEG